MAPPSSRGKGSNNNKKRGKGRPSQRRPNNKATNQSSTNASNNTNFTKSCNFVADAGPGCYIARRDGIAATTWLLDWEDIDRNEYECHHHEKDENEMDKNEEDDDELPEIAIDPEEQTLTLCNWEETKFKIAYITVFLDNGLTLQGRDGSLLRGASTTDDQGRVRSCITFIVLCPPLTFCHLCQLIVPALENNNDASSYNLLDWVELESDVQEWNRHENITDTHTQRVSFPLQCCGVEPYQSSYLCTQGEGGHLTHFFAGNQHAIDFACPVGTPILAVGDGVVVSFQDEHTLSGISVSNLFQWNSIMLRLDPPCIAKNNNDTLSNTEDNTQCMGDPLFVEYVHIQHNSVQVLVGDRVTKGQVIAYSGSVGFSPEPHLHFCAYRSDDATAPTVRVYFESENNNDNIFLPQAGIWYNADGPVVI